MTALLTRLGEGEALAWATAVAIIGLLYVLPKLAATGKREQGLPVSDMYIQSNDNLDTRN